jgi:hypothetical protein
MPGNPGMTTQGPNFITASQFAALQQELANARLQAYGNRNLDTYLDAYLLAAMYSGGYGAYGGGGYNPPPDANSPSYSTPPSYAPPAAAAPPVPSPQDRERRAEQATLERALTNPPVNEVTSGAALNVILADLQKLSLERGWKEMPATALDMPADMLARINVTRSEGSNIGILKKWDQLKWPGALSGDEFKLQRKQLDELVQVVITEAKTDGRVSADNTQKLGDTVSTLQQQLRDNTANLTFNMHAEAKTFLNDLAAGVAALQQPDVGFLINGEYKIKPQTIPELVRWMADNGLKLAAAMPGDEVAYTTLRERLATYDSGLRASANAAPPKPAGAKAAP